MKRLLVAAAFLASCAALEAAAIRPGIVTSNPGSLAANDDGSTIPAILLNIDGAGGINFFGSTATSVFVNNNGNVTFQNALSQFTPNGLSAGVGMPIIAPFFADVDTRAGSILNYGNGTVNGRAAFVVNYPTVGYFSVHVNKLNSFQLILIDRSDTGAGNFDIEFNYDQIQWETGDASGGSNGLGGTPAAAGFSNGLSGAANQFFQLPGSLTSGALLDGGPNSLIAGSLNSGVAGRYDFSVRNGQVLNNVPEPASIGLFGMGFAALGVLKLRRRKAA